MIQCVPMTGVISAYTGVVTLITCVMQTSVSPCLSANQSPVFSEEDQEEKRPTERDSHKHSSSREDIW